MADRPQLVTRFHRLVLLLLAAITVTAFLQVPSGALLPVHWGPHGEPDWVWPKDGALLLMPAVAVLLSAAVWSLGRLSPPEIVEPSRPVAEAVLTGVLFLFCAIQFGLLLIGIGSDIDAFRILAFAVSGLLLVLGLELPRADPKAYAGLRLPWSLHDGAWKTMHRLSGALFVLAAIGLGLAAWLQPDPATLIILLLGSVLLPIVLTGLISWLLSRKSATR